MIRRPRQDELSPVQYTVEPRSDAPRALASPLLIIYAFIGLISIGTLLLSLPVAHAGSGFTPFFDALFTATSAVTVTGLIVTDTPTYWTTWGKAFLALLMFVGGLGFMTLATFALVLMGQRVTLSQRLIIRESMGTSQLGGLVRLILGIVVMAIIFQLVGFVVLAIRFWGLYPPLEALGHSAFHSISAFNNAGFTVFTESGGLSAHLFDLPIVLTFTALIVFGSLGYGVIIDTVRARRFSLFALTTKMVLVMTAALIVVGAVVFFVFEYRNSETLGSLPFAYKLSTVVFESVSARTAGFSIVDYAVTEPQTNFFATSLMYIGGASVSVAGGIKVNTVAIVLVAVLSGIRGRNHTSAFGREIPDDQINKALVIVAVSIGFIFVGVISLSMLEPSIPFLDLFFETVSAFGTNGLSTGITPELSIPGRLVLILTMFIGRIGPFTIGIAMAQRAETDLYRYPVEPVTLG